MKSIGNSNYNGLVATVRGNKLWRGAGFFELSWTHAKSLDYNSSLFGTGNLPGETGAPPDGTNLRLEHGPSSFDVRNRFTAVWGVAWRGWSLQGITVAQSGTPFTVVSGNPDSNGFNQSTAGVSPNGGNRPDLIGSGPVARDDRNPDAAFDIAASPQPWPAAWVRQAGISIMVRDCRTSMFRSVGSAIVRALVPAAFRGLL